MAGISIFPHAFFFPNSTHRPRSPNDCHYIKHEQGGNPNAPCLIDTHSANATVCIASVMQWSCSCCRIGFYLRTPCSSSLKFQRARGVCSSTPLNEMAPFPARTLAKTLVGPSTWSLIFKQADDVPESSQNQYLNSARCV